LYTFAGTHPRFLVDGIEVAKKGTLEFLETFKTPFFMGDQPDREIFKIYKNNY
jgi:T-complex protein 1 subunit zeta